MSVDLLAGVAGAAERPAARRAPRIACIDSGLGGLTVHAEIARTLPDAELIYLADDAAFPYGRLDDRALVVRVEALVAHLVARHAPDVVVIACNTASTLALPVLRARFPIPFVGTVPAVKPAAALSRSGLISVLATAGTVRHDYTRELIAAHAAHCQVTLVGGPRLAEHAEAELRGAPVPDDAIAAEIAPAFVAAGDRRTDVVVLACTHYPLLLPRLRRLAPWPVVFVDPAPAIARRTASLVVPRNAGAAPRGARAFFTSVHPVPPGLHRALARRGFAEIGCEPLPFAGE